MTIRRDLIQAADAAVDDLIEAPKVVDAVLNALIDRLESTGFTASSRPGTLDADKLRAIRDGML